MKEDCDQNCFHLSQCRCAFKKSIESSCRTISYVLTEKGDEF